jgi:hypothetical protein
MLAFLLLAAASPELEHFEKQVRPVLIERCQSCHGAEKQRGGLRLDSRAALLKGGDSGPAIVPGDPAKSLLIKAIHWDGDLKMPSKEADRLSPAQIAALEAWVKSGASWPDEKTPLPTPSAVAQARKTHWSYQPIGRPTPPVIAGAGHPIDAFIVAKLHEKSLKLAPQSDRRTLLRRLSFDLTGLPPTPEELDAFEADARSDAYERVVDRLLASPGYGERWGRHWLDIARYADTKGYVFQEERRYPYSYTYRDYVIRALNEDLPYDRFIIEQLAADKLDLGNDKRPLAAMGFLTLGRRFLNNIHDIIDDRIDVVSRGLLGLTVSCARCHDHKYDAIPARDYYSLYGVFASSVEPGDLPIIADAGETAEFQKFQAELSKREGAVTAYLQSQRQTLVDRYRDQAGQYLVAAKAGGNARASFLNRPMLERWRNWLQAARQAQTHKEIFAALDGPEPAKAVQALIGPKSFQAKGEPLDLPENLEPFLDRAQRNRFRELQTQVDRWKATGPGAPPRAMVLVDAPRPNNPYVFLRGNPGNRGVSVPRQFLEVLSEDRKPFAQGSGRLELAQSIASSDNPLTARVMANRVWMHHFGHGLVRTPGDFGIRGEIPSHPKLLDWLARELIDSGWSLKQLHRAIVTSATYRQRSDSTAGEAVDPENRLLWKFNRRRLEFEPLRDAVLAVSGSLETTMGGKAVDITVAPYPPRRSVYAFIERQNLPGVFRTFDLASPDATTPQRHATTVPQQALFLMNSPFALQQAKAFARRADLANLPDEARLDRMVQLAYGRVPEAEERASALAFLREAGSSGWEQYAQVLLLSNEFAFVD